MKKKIINLFLILFLSIGLVSCKSKDGLDKYRENGQLIDLTAKELSNKIANKDTFIFFIKKKGCAICEKIYPEVSMFLDSNPEYLIYSIAREEIAGYDAYSYAAFFSNCIGKQYYDEQLDSRYGELFSPSFARIVQGEFIDAKIGYVTAEEISYLYQLNYTSYDYYYNFTRTLSYYKTSVHFFSLNNDNDYDQMLRNYFKENKMNIGYYYDVSKFLEEDKVDLLFRINKAKLQPKILELVNTKFELLEDEILEVLNLDSSTKVDTILKNNESNFSILLLNSIKNNELNQESINLLRDSILDEFSTLFNEGNKEVIKLKIENTLNISLQELNVLCDNLDLLTTLPDYFALSYENANLSNVIIKKMTSDDIKNIY